jgi:hexosaminidase
MAIQRRTIQYSVVCGFLMYACTAWSAGPYYGFPKVFAGYDQSFLLEQASSVMLKGLVPANTLSVQWKQTHGVSAEIVNPTSLETEVRNMQVGWNVFVLTATFTDSNNASVTASSEVKIKVHATLPENDVAVVPYPQSLVRREGSLSLSSTSTLSIADPVLKPLAAVLADEIQLKTGIQITTTQTYNPSSTVVLRINPNISAEEGYRLSVSNTSAVVEAKTYRGAAWGTVSLIQCLQNNGVLPLVEITDQPFAPYRGVLIDVARKYHPIPYMKELIQLFRMNKINYVQLHLNDLEGTAFPFSNPELRKVPKEFTVWTMEEVKDLVAYADARGVTLVPELEGPGHHAGNLRNLYGRSDANGKNRVIDIANEATYKGMETLIDELLTVFTSTPYVHIGADESDLGALGKTPEEQAYMSQNNVSNLLGHYITRMNDIIRRKGKTTVVWEGFGGDGGGVPRNVIVMPFESAYNPANALTQLGYSVINTAWKPLYVVGSRNWAPDYIYNNWNMWLWEHHINTGVHIQLPRSAPVLGAQICAWEQPATAELESLRYRVGSMAERTWNPDTSQPYASFDARNMANNNTLEHLLGHPTIESQTLLGEYQNFDMFSDPLRITLRTPHKGVIKYTVDGSEPDLQSPSYTNPFTLDKTHTNGVDVLYNQRVGSFQTAAALVTLKTRVFINAKPQGFLPSVTSFWNRSLDGKPFMPPVVKAGPDIQATWPLTDGSITLMGVVDDSDLAVSPTVPGFFAQWRQISGNAANIQTVSTNDRRKYSIKITNLSQGRYTFQLYARDSEGNTSIDNVLIAIGGSTPPTNAPPQVDAGADQTLTAALPYKAALVARASDPDGSLQSFRWTLVSGDASASILIPSSLNSSVQFSKAGTYLFAFTATDNLGASSSDTVQIIMQTPSTPVNTGNAYPFSGVLVNPNTTIPKNFYGKLTGNGGIGWQTGVCSIDFALGAFDFSVDSGSGNNLNYSGALSGSGSVQYVAAPYSSTYAAVPIVLSGAKPHTYTGQTILKRGVLRLSKPQGTNSIPGDLLILKQGSNDALEWTASDQIADHAEVTVQSPQAQLRIKGYHEKIASLNLVANAAVVFDTSNTGVLETTHLAVAGTLLAQNTYTSANASFVLGNGRIVVGTGIPINNPPAVRAFAPSGNVTLPKPILLRAEAQDSDGLASVSWSAPDHTNVVFSAPQTLETSATVTSAGTYRFVFQATDKKGKSASVSVSVTVSEPPLWPVSNLENNATVSYSLPLLKGTFANEPDGLLSVTNAMQETTQWPIFQKRFKALVKLKPGPNRLLVTTSQNSYVFNVYLELPNNVKKMRLFYFLGSDQNGEIDAPPGTPNNIDEALKRIQLDALMLQTFFAESYQKSRTMADPTTLHPRVTFHYALDEKGDPKVHVIRHPKTRAELAALGGNTIYSEACFYANSMSKFIGTLPIEEQWNPADAMRMIWTGIAHIDPATGVYNKAGMALGGANCSTIHTGNLITHAASLEEVDTAFSNTQALPTQYIVDDSYGRKTYWGSYTATLGGMMHETGHAFRLPHVNVGVMATDASANINRFFSVFVQNNDGSKYPIHDNNELRNNEPQWPWWTASDIKILEPQNTFIY